MGELVHNDEEQAWLGYNEYIVYDERRVRIKYVVMVRF